MLKDIPTGSTFTIRLVEPMKSGFQGIAPRNKGGAKQTKQGYGSGKETLRFKSNGNAAIEDEVRIGCEMICASRNLNENVSLARRCNSVWNRCHQFTARFVYGNQRHGTSDASEYFLNQVSKTEQQFNTLQFRRSGTSAAIKPTRWTLPRRSMRPTWRRLDSPTTLSSNCGERSPTPGRDVIKDETVPIEDEVDEAC